MAIPDGPGHRVLTRRNTTPHAPPAMENALLYESSARQLTFLIARQRHHTPPQPPQQEGPRWQRPEGPPGNRRRPRFPHRCGRAAAPRSRLQPQTARGDDARPRHGTKTWPMTTAHRGGHTQKYDRRRDKQPTIYHCHSATRATPNLRCSRPVSNLVIRCRRSRWPVSLCHVLRPCLELIGTRTESLECYMQHDHERRSDYQPPFFMPLSSLPPTHGTSARHRRTTRAFAGFGNSAPFSPTDARLAGVPSTRRRTNRR